MPLINDITSQNIPLSDFFLETNYMTKKAMALVNKRNRLDNDPIDFGKYIEGPLERETWKTVDDWQYQESPFIRKGTRKPYGRLYSRDMLLLENQSPQLWPEEILVWEQNVVRYW